MANARVPLSRSHWRRSSHCNGDGGYCVEVAHGCPEVIPVRDSKTAAQNSSVLLFSPSTWASFLTSLKAQP